MTPFQIPIKEGEFLKRKEEIQDNLFPIELEIVEKLFDEVAVEGFKDKEERSIEWETRGAWTYMIIKCLRNVGNHEGFLVFPKPKKEDIGFEGEWLFDLVWIDAKPKQKDNDESEQAFDWRGTRGLKLACESEWSTNSNDILKDFLKLTFVLADIHLFIYTNKKVAINNVKVHPVELCKRACPLSRGFRYLLVGFPERKGEGFRVDSWAA